MKQGKNILQLTALLVLAITVASCGRDKNDPGIQFSPEMYESIPYEPFKQVMDSTAPFSNGGKSLWEPPKGTISRDGYAAFEFPEGDSVKGFNAELKALKNPVELTESSLDEGKVFYERFCSACHGKKGAGNGKVAQHDAINPSAFNSDEIKGYTPGQIYHTIMYGQGVMGSYASQLEVEERWKVVHYVQTMQGGAASDSTATDAGDAAGEEGAEEGNEEGASEEGDSEGDESVESLNP